MMIYRATRGSPNVVGAFWASNRAYPLYVHSGYPLYVATLSRLARVKSFRVQMSGSLVHAATIGGYDVARFPIWDFKGYEYVVIRPQVVLGVRRLL